MKRLRYVMGDLLFAWWDGVASLGSLVFVLTASVGDFALSQMHRATRMNARTSDALLPEAQAMLEDIDQQRAQLHESIRVAAVKLDKLDAAYARIQHVGRKQ